MLRMPSRPAFAALTCAALLVGAPAVARADVGAGVEASPIELASTAQPGGTYQLPSLLVVNTGTVASSYRVGVEQFPPAQGRPVPAGWIVFAVNDFPLQPRQSTRVGLTLTVPDDAATGDYQSDLVVGTVAPSSGTGAIASAQAATKLMFTVGEGGGFPWPWPLWSYAVLGLIVLSALLTLLQRRFRFRLHLERR